MTRLLVDHVFAGLPPQAAPAAPGDTPPPAPLAVPATPEAERAWLAEERTRLEAFAAGQFDAIARQRRQLAEWQSQIEAALVTRGKEQNRLQKHLEHQALALAERESRCAALEADLAARRAEQAGLTADVRRLFAERTELEGQVAELLAEADAFRGEMAEADVLRREMAETRRTCRELADAVDALRAERDGWRQRLEDLRRQELALQRRAAELDELEARPPDAPQGR